MELTSKDTQHKRFRTRWMGLDAKQVEDFCQQQAEEIDRLKLEVSNLRKDFGEQAKELLEYKEREKTIRTVLLNAHKTAEQVKANAEKEAKLIVAEAELKAEKTLQGAHQRLAQVQGDIEELRRHRTLLETKLRSTIEAYQQLLNIDKDEEKENEPVSNIKFLKR